MIKSVLPPAEFRRLAIAAGLLLLLLMSSGARGQDATFMDADRAFALAVTRGTGGRVSLHWQIAPGYYLYRSRMAVTPEPGSSRAEWTLPPGVAKRDPNFGSVEVYHDSVRLDVAAPHATALNVVWQGCAEAGLCYPPQQRTVMLTGTAGDALGRGRMSHPSPAPHEARGRERRADRLLVGEFTAAELLERLRSGSRG